MRPNRSRTALSSLLAAILWIPPACCLGQDSTKKEPGSNPRDGGTSGSLLAELLAAHNRERTREKKPPLKLNDRLNDAARVQARDMAEHDQLRHEGSDGSKPSDRIKRAGYVYQACGENVADGQETVAEVMRSWMNSPPHRENILGDFSEMGGAVARSPDGRNYWCVDFGRPMAAVDVAKSPAAMIEALNRARSAKGKAPLKEEAQLAETAARFARAAAVKKSLDVKDQDGKTPFQALKAGGYRARALGMILSSGEGDPQKVVDAWARRPEDRDALLSPFDQAGVGVATDSEGVPYWVLILAQSASD